MLQNFIRRFEIVPLCNQMLVLADDTRGLKASRFMKSIQQSRKIALAVARDAGISFEIKAGLERSKSCLIFG
jgi:hypothetical protein